MTRAEREQAAGHATGIWTPLTSFVGRANDAAELTDLLADYRLVTVTGPGGVGKSRLATEVAQRVADRFPDGVWLIDLGAVADEAHVPAEVMSALGVQEDPGRPPLEVLAEAVAPRRLLLVLDNCEHLLSAVADLGVVLLKTADEVSVLATSREQLGVGGETQYRLWPLELPRSGEPEEVAKSAAGALFTERARQAYPRFTLDAESAPLVSRVVTQLDGMPLAIELAAARVEALGLAGLADRINDALRLLADGDRLAAPRHWSLAAVADWSYRLLTEPEQRVFRRLAVFPGSFTLEAAEAVAGREAGLVVLRLVDCSLLVPPRPGADQRTRYTMLQILRAYALTRLKEAGEEQDAMAALAAFAWSVAEKAAAGLDASDDRELQARRWLDAEDATLSRALGWALDHDCGGALRLAAALAPWLRQRGRPAEARERLRTALARSSPADEGWARAQLWLGHVSSGSTDLTGAIDCFTAVIDAHQSGEPSPELVQALVGRTVVRLNRGDDPATVHDSSRALALARQIGYTAGELEALTGLSLTGFYARDAARVLEWARQAQELLWSDVPGPQARWCRYILADVLTETGELDSARGLCAAALAPARQADDRAHLISLLSIMARIERLAGNLAQTKAYLCEGADVAARSGDHVDLANLVNECGYGCAASGCSAEAVTLWAAHSADRHRRGLPSEPGDEHNRAEHMRRIERELKPAQLREARERGARMSISAAAELVIMLTTAVHETAPESAPGKLLSPRERELVTLVAQGHTNAEIAARLHISARTVVSHLDRIRDKTGLRRRADLTRLAVAESLV